MVGLWYMSKNSLNDIHYCKVEPKTKSMTRGAGEDTCQQQRRCARGAHLCYLLASFHHLWDVAELPQEAYQTFLVAFHPLIGHAAVTGVHQLVPGTDHLEAARTREQRPQDHDMCTISDVAS